MSEFNQVVEEGVKKVGQTTRRIILGILLLAIIGLGVYLWVCNWTYSEGTRAGTLIKMSYKGVLLKTYEGQLNLGGFQTNGQDGVVGNIWEFSVWSDDIYKELQNFEGKRVKLHYRQKFKAMPWQGKTDYFIFKVDSITD